MNRIAMVVGKRGAGKSYFVKNTLLPGFRKPIVIIDPMQEYGGDRFYSVEQFVIAVTAGRTKQAALTLETDDEVFEVFAYCYHIGPHVLVIEELHLYANAWSREPTLQRLFRLGRHRGIDIVGISQRIVDLPQIALTQADDLIIFRQQGTRDIERVKQLFDDETASRVSALPDQVFEHIRM